MTTSFQETAANSASSIPEEKTLSILSLILEGGIAGQIIIALLLGLLTASLYIYFERFFAIKSASKVDKDFMNQIKDQVANGSLEAAKSLCASR